MSGIPHRPLFGIRLGRMAIDYVRKVTWGREIPNAIGEQKRRFVRIGKIGPSFPRMEVTSYILHGIEQMILGGFALPEIDLETGRAEYRWALPKVIDSFGVDASAGNRPTTEVETPNTKGKMRNGRPIRKPETRRHHVAHGPLRLYPVGKRLLKPERHLAMRYVIKSITGKSSVSCEC